MKKGQWIKYRSWCGKLYTAIIRTAHKDGSLTIEVYFPLRPNGSENTFCFQGDKFRIGQEHIAQ